MTDSAPARLAYLTTPNGELILNLQTEAPAMFDDNNFIRLRLSRDQLAGLARDGVWALLGGGER